MEKFRFNGRVLKVLASAAVFLLASFPVSFLLKDDANSYARALFHEFYAQERIDYLICGASHVSHGVEANMAGERFGRSVFNTGTPSQKIDGTLAILRQAVKLHRIEKVFLELDFAITCEGDFSERTGFKASYIVADGIRDFGIRAGFLLNCSKPKYYLNHLLPIGKDKMLTLNPKKVGRKMRSLLNGDYFECRYGDEDSEYAGRGCVMDLDGIPEGGFSNGEREMPIDVRNISRDWIETVDEIISLCAENGIELIFYSMPGSDFYLNERGNYDEYYAFCRNFCAERGFPYYDFNLARPELLSLSDGDYTDDNHLGKRGVLRWTEVFCDFFSGKHAEADALEKYFYASYAEKMSAMGPRIFGIYAIESGDRRTLSIEPVTNASGGERISYTVTLVSGGREEVVQSDSENAEIDLDFSGKGRFKVRIESFLDGVPQTDCTRSFFSFQGIFR